MHLHHHHHFDPELTEQLFKTLQIIINSQKSIMTSIDTINAALTAQANALNKETLAIKSVIATLDGIKGQLDQALADGADGAALQAIADQISNQTAQLNASTDLINAAVVRDVPQAVAVGSNTPAADAGSTAASGTAADTSTSAASGASTDSAASTAAADAGATSTDTTGTAAAASTDPVNAGSATSAA